MDQERLTQYWLDIPVGRDRAVRYSDLCDLWKVTRRRAIEILQELALYPLDDGFILIRSSHSAGFYKTDDPEEIKAFRLECLSRGRACLAPIAKINRVLRDQPYTFDLLTALDQVEAADDSC